MIDTNNIYYVDEIICGKNNKCPVDGCTGGGKDGSKFYRHFCYQHPNAEIIIRSDGELEKCESCGLRCINLQRHKNSKTCMRHQVNQRKIK